MYRHIHSLGKRPAVWKTLKKREALLTQLHCSSALLPQGLARDVRLTIRDGLIETLETGVPPKQGDERFACVLPGMPNLHSHAFQRAMAGLAERRGPGADSFWSWREQMYHFALSMTPDDLEAVATKLYAEMLEAGFTRVGEFHYLHHDRDGSPFANIAEMSERIAAAAQETGIGLTLLPVAYARGGFGGLPSQEGQRRFINTPERYARLLEGARAAVSRLDGGVVGVAPHSLRAVTPEELAAFIAMAGDKPIHIHIAEQVKEVEDCLTWSGQRPVEWLLAHADVDARWCLIHATHMIEEETLALARSGAVAGLCPITEANLGDGFFPVSAFRDAGGLYGIGSDSNVEITVSGELRLLEYGQRLLHRARNVIANGAGASTGVTLLSEALHGGAQALGAGPSALEVGASADLVALRHDHPALPTAREDTLVDSWIFAQSHGLIDSVYVRGIRLVTGGRHVRAQMIDARFAATMRRLASQ